MIVKKSTIVIISAVCTILVWGSYQCGVNYGCSRAKEAIRATQKSNRFYPMQNGESGLERLKTVNLGRLEVRLCPSCRKGTLRKRGLIFECSECGFRQSWEKLGEKP